MIDMNGMKPDSISAALMSLLAYGYDKDAYTELMRYKWSFVDHENRPQISSDGTEIPLCIRR